MDGKAMEKNFDDILNGGGDSSRNFEVTKEEATKFKQAMADPEFQSMLKDYMEEIQDPAARAEQEKYITELEHQNRVPEGKEIIHPSPGFVIKTKYAKDAKDAEDGRREKLFVNVVSSQKLAKPYSKPSPSRSGGEMWSLPVAVGQMRLEKDKSGDSTTTFDVCYHPEALVRAKHGSAFRNLVALSSLERVEDAFRRNERNMTIDKNYRILKGIKYKSGGCATMLASKTDLVRPQTPAAKGGGNAETATMTPSPTTKSTKKGASNAETPASAPIADVKKYNKLAAAKVDSAAANTDDAAANTDDAAANTDDAAVNTNDAAVNANDAAVNTNDAAARVGGDSAAEAAVLGRAGSGVETSVEAKVVALLSEGHKRGNAGTLYKLVESGCFEIADHTMEREKEARLPQHLIVTVTLPADAEPTRKLDVIVTSRRLAVGVAGDPDESAPRYLDLALPYDVEDESKCSAKRDKTGLLKITMPVKPPCKRPPSPVGVVAAATSTSGSDDAKETLADEERNDVDTSESKQPASAANWQPDHSRWVKDHEAREKLDKPWESMPRREEGEGAIDATLPPPPDAHQRSNADAANSMDPACKNNVDIARGIAEDAAFIGCPVFSGKMDGYEFKTDVQGCGYYRDDRGTKVPPMRWHETPTKMSGIAEVPQVVDSSVRYVFRGNVMTLSFKARVEGDGDDKGVIERYRTELVLAGGVDATKTEHDTADNNIMIKLAKDPATEWNKHPIPTSVTRVSGAIDSLLSSAGGGGSPNVERAPSPRAVAGTKDETKDGKREGGASEHGKTLAASEGQGKGAVTSGADLGAFVDELD